jgi:hypothetical protein
MELQRRKGQPVLSVQALYDKFLPKYTFWAHRPGGTNTSTLCELVRELGIAATANVFIDPSKIVQESGRPEYVGLVGMTERLPVGNGVAIFYHALLIDPRDADFDAWNPLADGTELNWPNLAWQKWADWKMHGLVLYR